MPAAHSPSDHEGILLYRHVGCPYCERVVRVAEELDVPLRSRFVVPTHSQRDAVKRASGQRAVPVLVDEERGLTMAESANVVAYLERTYGDARTDVEAGDGGDDEADGTDFPFDVVSLPPSDHPTVGETVPDFTRPLVNGEHWEDATLSEIAADGPVLLAFLPMDGTGMTTHTCIDVRRRGWADDVTVVGYSISTPYEHVEFIRDHVLPFPLFSDPRAGVAERYDVTHDHDGMTGLVGARPAFFLLEPDLTVTYAWAAAEWPASRPYEGVERAIDAL